MFHASKELLRLRRALCCIVLLFCGMARAEDALKLEDLFPDTTLVALAIPDLEAARKSADGSRIGQMLKEPAMREFLDPIVARMKSTYAEAHAANPMIPTLDDLDKGLLNSEVGISVFSRGPGKEPGFVFSLKPKDVKAFETILGAAFHGNPIPKDPIPFGGDQEPGALYANGRILVAFPMSELATYADRAADAQKRAEGALAANASFKEGRSMLKESAGWLYAAPAAGVKFFESMIPPGDAEAAQVLKVLNTLGVDKLNTIMVGLSFAGGEPAIEAYLGTGGFSTGIFGLIGKKSVSKDMLQLAAQDAPYAGGMSFNFSEIMPLVRSVVAIFGPDAVKELNDGLAEVNGTLTFDVEKDLLDNLEPEIVVAQTAHDTGLPLSMSPGMVMAIKLKNGAKMEECLKKLKSLVDTHFTAAGIPGFLMQVKTTTYKGASIYYASQIVNLNGGIVLAVVKDRLVWGDSLNAVRRSIDQLSSGSNILSNKSLQTAVARVSGKPFDANDLPLSFTFAEDNATGSGTLLLTGLGIAAGTAGVAAASEAANEGKVVEGRPGPPKPFDELSRSHAGKAALNVADAIDLNLWPDAEFFIQRRLSHASVTIKTEKGWLSRTEFPPPLPRYGNISPAVIAGVAIMAVAITPAFARAREAGRRSVNSDNLKQIHYCLVMYEQEKGKYPDDPAELYPQYTDDVRIFKSVRDPGLEAGFTLIAGMSSENARAMVAFENPPTNSPKSGRNVLSAGGAVYFVQERQFQEQLKQAEADAKAAGRAFKLVPMNAAEIEKKAVEKKRLQKK